MKRLLVIVLCVGVVLGGCKKTEDVAKKDLGLDKVVTPVVEPVASPSNSFVLVKGRDMYVSNKPRFVLPSYEAKVRSYTIASDLANVDNIGRFSGFTKDQVAMLANSGFVVLPDQNTRMHYIYDYNEYLEIPNFITTDSVLHMYHQFYDKSLMYIELTQLNDSLKKLTERMLDQSIDVYKELKDDHLKMLQGSNVAYFLVATMLLDPASPAGAAVDPSLVKLAKEELELIDKADMFEKSPLFGVKLDYSQFKVRGHYTRADELGRYFKAMMWYGTAALGLLKNNGDSVELLYDNAMKSLLMSFTAFLKSGEDSAVDYWAKIYIPTGQYVGLSDDIQIYQMNKVREEVFGAIDDPNVLGDKSYYDKLLETVKALPEPRIQPEFVDMDMPPSKKQFRFMGQRYIMDSHIMQDLITAILRPLPSALDVMGVFGNETAEDLTFNYYKPQERWPEYTERYMKLKEEVSGYTEETWTDNLYNGWLWSIREALTEYGVDSGMPKFMTANSWKYKSLNTAQGSYTELKHDTVLYGKQAAAEMGGPLLVPQQHYVEPNIPLYSKVLYLVDYTLSVLQDYGVQDETLTGAASQFKDLLQLLIDCSVKELRNEPLSEEENDRLLHYGGTMEYIIYSLLAGVASGLSDGGNPVDLSDMLVTDVATNPGAYLSLGTGYFDTIYVVVPTADGKLVLTRGAVYSFYEFVSPDRLTDEQWWELQGLSMEAHEYGYVSVMMDQPSPDLPAQPDWVSKFKSTTNHVKIEEREVDWSQLRE